MLVSQSGRHQPAALACSVPARLTHTPVCACPHAAAGELHTRLHAERILRTWLGQKLVELVASGDLARAAQLSALLGFAAGDVHIGQHQLVFHQSSGEAACVAGMLAFLREIGVEVSDLSMLVLVGGNGDPAASSNDRCAFHSSAVAAVTGGCL